MAITKVLGPKLNNTVENIIKAISDQIEKNFDEFRVKSQKWKDRLPTLKTDGRIQIDLSSDSSGPGILL